VARPREVSDAQIIKAARKVFLEQGTQVPVTAVARELGVSSATLFLRMGSKRKLIIAALWPPDPSVLDRLRNGFDRAAPIEQQLRQILYDVAVYAEAEIPATFTLYAAGLRAEPGDDFSDVAPLQLRRALSRWLEQAVRCGAIGCEPRVIADLAIGALEARAMHAFLATRQPSARATRTFIRGMVAAILGSSAGEKVQSK
jgi:AcrR family transcriptional regulator